jgi:ethanolamine ammonia-lyase large subunit
MGVPGADDIMLNYQSTSFHDALAMRHIMGLRTSPEFESWLQAMEIFETGSQSRLVNKIPAALVGRLRQLEGQ